MAAHPSFVQLSALVNEAKKNLNVRTVADGNLNFFSVPGTAIF